MVGKKWFDRLTILSRACPELAEALSAAEGGSRMGQSRNNSRAPIGVQGRFYAL